MKLITQGHSGLCSFCRGQVIGKIGGIVTPLAGPPIILCLKCAQSGVLGDLLGSAIADWQSLPAPDEGQPDRRLDADAVLDSFASAFRAASMR